jgi:putative tricarboxylic transport membrane protein
MLGFGLFGYFADRFGYSPAPLVLAFVLGPLMETSLRQSLILSQGALSIFVDRPISAALLALAAIVVAMPLVRRLPGVRALGWAGAKSKS